MSRISIHLRKQAAGNEADQRARTLPHQLQQFTFEVPNGENNRDERPVHPGTLARIKSQRSMNIHERLRSRTFNDKCSLKASSVLKEWAVTGGGEVRVLEGSGRNYVIGKEGGTWKD
jgi:hypothetical protein